ncbi:hypothetical protein [Paenibacillus odorifer]|uniref:hypothetical protein n=1 Tax=Paenibacillus TaxID=44249 RepID=UPI00096DE58C|nr:hypothetical protein [Paenibacillus odorifer]OMD00876.1 hypothetical protein BJP46_18785 [Paenibacillus odorifer]
MTNPMTPEEIEETKKLLSIASNDTLQSISMDLLAALEESQQQVNDLKEDKRKIFAVHDEQCARSSEYYNELIFVKGKLAEAQQTIARQHEQIKTQDKIITGHSRIIARYHDALIKISQDTTDERTAAFAWSVLE